MRKLKLKLIALRVWWLKRQVGTVAEFSTSALMPAGCWYMGLNYHHPKYKKLRKLQDQLDSAYTWRAD